MAVKLPKGSGLLLLCAAVALLAVAHASPDSSNAGGGRGGGHGSGGGHGGHGGSTGPGTDNIWSRRMLSLSSLKQWGGRDSWSGDRRWDRWGNWNNPWNGGWVRMPNMPNIPDDSRFDDNWW